MNKTNRNIENNVTNITTLSANKKIYTKQEIGNKAARGCYICGTKDENVVRFKFHDMVTSHNSIKFPNKIGQILGNNFTVVVSVEDVLCQKCIDLINNFDLFESSAEQYKRSLLTSLNKKYNLEIAVEEAAEVSNSPPIKIRKAETMESTVTNIVAKKPINLTSVSQKRLEAEKKEIKSVASASTTNIGLNLKGSKNIVSTNNVRKLTQDDLSKEDNFQNDNRSKNVIKKNGQKLSSEAQKDINVEMILQSAGVFKDNDDSSKEKQGSLNDRQIEAEALNTSFVDEFFSFLSETY